MSSTFFKWLLILPIAITFLFSCDPVDRRLTIVNNTSKPIFNVISTDNILDEENPNFEQGKKLFIIDKNQDTVWTQQDYFVPPHSENDLEIIGTNAWTDFINSECHDSAINIFILDAEVVVKEPWNKILSEKN